MTIRPNIMGLMGTSEDFHRHNALNHIQLCDQLDLTRMAPIIWWASLGTIIICPESLLVTYLAFFLVYFLGGYSLSRYSELIS